LKRPTEDQTEAVHYARCSHSKRLLNDVFIWFTGRNVFTLHTLKNSHNNQLYAAAATNKKDVEAKRFLCTRMTFSQLLYCFICQYQSCDWLWRPPPKWPILYGALKSTHSLTQLVKFWLQLYDNNQCQSWNQWSLLLCFTSTTMRDA